MKNGLYHTGDRCIIDKDGYLKIVGRTTDMIKIGGNRVSAKEIEEAILRLDGVEDTVVIAIPDPFLGEAAKAFIVGTPGFPISENTIREELISMLPSFKIPSVFELCEFLPKNESGKILKAQLK